MPNKRLICLVCLFVALSMLPAHLTVAQPAPDPFLAMLALIPDTPEARPSNGLGVSYADYHAVLEASGIKIPASMDEFKGLADPARAQIMSVLMRIIAGPGSLMTYFLRIDSRMVGFEWVDISRAAAFGAPPHDGMILAGTFDADKIGAALTARKFEKNDVEGVTVWSRFQDAEMRVTAREPGDPFGGAMGMAARIAVLPGYLANSRYWDMTKSIIAVSKKEQKSLADAPDYRALADAITDPQTYQGTLLQVLFFPVHTLETGKFDVQGLPNPPDLSQYADLPAYSLAALADRQEGATQVHLIALLYPDADTAQRAADELQKRIAGFDITKIYAKFGVTVDQARVYKAESGMAVAVVSVHYGLPSATPDPETKLYTQPGLIFRLWVNAIYRRQFLPLVIGAPKP
jgi:hypothetical protein